MEIRFSPIRAALVAVLFAACAEKKPLQVLPSDEKVELMALRDENAHLKKGLAELTKNCSAVLRVFKEAGLKGRAPAARNK